MRQVKLPAVNWPHPGWAWTVGRDWVIPTGVGAATLFIGAALGGIYGVVGGSWHNPQTRDQAWFLIAFGAVGLIALIGTLFVWRGRNRLLRRNGTSYIVQEEAREWQHDEARDFLADARRHFARMIRIPGPGMLGGHWDWPLGEGAKHWDSKVTELARSFQALHFDDDPETPNGIFLWAWWAVAVAFGAQVTAADRGLFLDVWQRPSRGRAGHFEAASWSQRPHQFGQGAAVASLHEILPESALQEFTWPTRVTAIPREPRPNLASPGGHELAVLLVRLGRQSWGPIAEVPATPDPANPVNLVLDDAAGVGGSAGDVPAEIHELRCIPPGGGTQFPWPAFPPLVAEVSAWIRAKTAGLQGHTVLLATVMPPETALGLGIDAAQVGKPGWPTHLWPIVYQKSIDAMIVPSLDLGTAAFLPQAGGT